MAELEQADALITAGTVIPVVAETAEMGTRVVETGRVRIHKGVVETDQVVDALLRREDVQVQRVPVGREVSEAPQPRQEGDTWIVPILEEVLVVETRLRLKEELHIRTVVTQEAVQRTVRLREETVDITQLGGEASPANGGDNR